jgi:hypothetical protein
VIPPEFVFGGIFFVCDVNCWTGGRKNVAVAGKNVAIFKGNGAENEEYVAIGGR